MPATGWRELTCRIFHFQHLSRSDRFGRDNDRRRRSRQGREPPNCPPHDNESEGTGREILLVPQVAVSRYEDVDWPEHLSRRTRPDSPSHRREWELVTS